MVLFLLSFFLSFPLNAYVWVCWYLHRANKIEANAVWACVDRTHDSKCEKYRAYYKCMCVICEGKKEDKLKVKHIWLTCWFALRCVCNRTCWVYSSTRSHVNARMCLRVCECEEECKENRTASMLLLTTTKQRARKKNQALNGKEINERLVSMVKCRFSDFCLRFFSPRRRRRFFLLFCFFHHTLTLPLLRWTVLRASVWVWFGWLARLSGIHFSYCCASWLNRLNLAQRARLFFLINCTQNFQIVPNRLPLKNPRIRDRLKSRTEKFKKYFDYGILCLCQINLMYS